MAICISKRTKVPFLTSVCGFALAVVVIVAGRLPEPVITIAGGARARAPAETSFFFPKLPLCLSRACLGKKIVFTYKGLKKGRRNTENVFRRTHPCPRMAPATSCHSVHQTATHTTHPGPSVYPSCPCTPHRCRRRQWHSLRAWHRTAQAPARRSDGEAPMTRTALVLSSESH